MTRLCARSMVVDQDLVDMDRRAGLRTTAEDTADTDRTCLTTADTLPITAGDGPCPTMEVEEDTAVVALRQLPPLLLAEEEVAVADPGITLRSPPLTTLL